MALDEERGGAELADLPLHDAITLLGETPVGSAVARLELVPDLAFVVINRERGNDRTWYVQQAGALAAMLRGFAESQRIADVLPLHEWRPAPPLDLGTDLGEPAWRPAVVLYGDRVVGVVPPAPYQAPPSVSPATSDDHDQVIADEEDAADEWDDYDEEDAYEETDRDERDRDRDRDVGYGRDRDERDDEAKAEVTWEPQPQRRRRRGGRERVALWDRFRFRYAERTWRRRPPAAGDVHASRDLPGLAAGNPADDGYPEGEAFRVYPRLDAQAAIRAGVPFVLEVGVTAEASAPTRSRGPIEIPDAPAEVPLVVQAFGAGFSSPEGYPAHAGRAAGCARRGGRPDRRGGRSCPRGHHPDDRGLLRVPRQRVRPGVAAGDGGS